MPTAKDVDPMYPHDLLESETSVSSERNWWAVYTRARQEKAFARDLCGRGIPYYLPLVRQAKRYGRRTIKTDLPLFPSYVFVCCSEDERVGCLETNRISRMLDVSDPTGLRYDLHQLSMLIESGAPLTAESRLVPGKRVRIKYGRLAGLEGVVIARRSETRLLIAVNFLQQGASVAIEDYCLEPCAPVPGGGMAGGTIEVAYHGAPQQCLTFPSSTWSTMTAPYAMTSAGS